MLVRKTGNECRMPWLSLRNIGLKYVNMLHIYKFLCPRVSAKNSWYYNNVHVYSRNFRVIVSTCIRETFALSYVHVYSRNFYIIMCPRISTKLSRCCMSTCIRETFTLSLKIVTKKLFSWLRKVGSRLDKRSVRHLIVQSVSYTFQTLYLWRGYIRELGVIVEWLSLNQKVTIL